MNGKEHVFMSSALKQTLSPCFLCACACFDVQLCLVHASCGNMKMKKKKERGGMQLKFSFLCGKQLKLG